MAELEILLVHAQGEIGNVILSGAPEVPGATILEKMTYINEVDDSLRRFVCLEPRAHVAMTVNLLLPPTRPDADAAFIVLQADRAHPMSGSNAICTVTALLETGRIPMTAPETLVRLDTAAGLILARARCEGGRCLSVSLDNVPAFVLALDHPVDTPYGKIKVDIAFGGVFYAQIDTSEIGLTIEPKNARALAEAGMAIKSALAGTRVAHPTLPGLTEIAYVMFRDARPDGGITTCTTLAPGRVDRSPCGTGSSANLAVMQARGLLQLHRPCVSHSIIGGQFTAEAIGTTTVGPYPAVLPRITGAARVFGRQFLDYQPGDLQFALSDTWGPLLDQG